MAAERINLFGGMPSQADRNHGLKADSEGTGVDGGVKTGEYTFRLETPHSLRAGRRSHADSGREFLVRQPRILLEDGDDGVIRSVECWYFSHSANPLRCGWPSVEQYPTIDQ